MQQYEMVHIRPRPEPWNHRCRFETCDDIGEFVTEPDIGVIPDPDRVVICGAHLSWLLLEAYKRQRHRGDRFVSLVVEPYRKPGRPRTRPVPGRRVRATHLRVLG